jgi:heme exporter protein A
VSSNATISSTRLEVDNLSVSRAGRLVIEDISFCVAPGEAVIVTGPNGAGKTTLLRALAGLLSPTSGRIACFRSNEGEISIYSHFVGHDDALKPALTARENLDFWAAALRIEVGASPIAALARLGLPRAADIPVGWLSAGQRRRVALARLLVAERPIWILDEPTTALDAASQSVFAGIMADHLSRGGVIVAATHAPLGLGSVRELRLGAAS